MMDYYNHPARTLSNAHLSLDFLTQAGPRIVRLSLAGSEDNLLAELPDMALPTSFGDFHILPSFSAGRLKSSLPASSLPLDFKESPVVSFGRFTSRRPFQLRAS